MPEKQSEPSESQINFQAPATGVAGKVEGDQIIHIYGSNNLPLANNNRRTHQLVKKKSQLGKVVAQEHKYDGQLVLIEFEFSNDSGLCLTKQICIILNITFGEIEENIEYRDGLVFGKRREGYIRFGVKHGKLHLSLKNGVLPLRQRALLEEIKENWQVTTTGVEKNPVWEFKVAGESEVLGGMLTDEKLGIINLSNTFCNVEATFKVQINGNDLEITAQDGAWNDNDKPQVIATKRRAFFKKVVEPKLKDYLSKVTLQYDSAIVS